MLEKGLVPALLIDNLTVVAKNKSGERAIVDGVTLSVAPGEALGIIGESGSGKSTIALAVMNYLAPGLRVAGGSIVFEGKNLLGTKHSRGLYGRRIAHVAQDPAAALNPVIRIGRQLTEGMRKHLGLSTQEERARALKLLEEVHLTGVEALLESYPYELSGGMQQRICIAMALACDPDLLILDEPTTGLDARTESAILEILAELKQKRKLSLLLISHNIAAISDIADRVAVLYGGKLMECGPIDAVLKRPAHRYTKLLLNAVPTIVGAQRPLVDIPWQESALPRSGCPFRGRCDLAVEACADGLSYRDISHDHISACVRWKDAACDVDTKAGGEVLDVRRVVQSAGAPVLEADFVSFTYKRSLIGDQKSNVLNEVGLSLGRGEVVALIGESGSGKSTFARVLVGLLRAQVGRIGFRGQNLAALRRYPLEISRFIQIVFQNIAGSLHPRKRVGDVIARPFRLYERRSPSAAEIASLISPLGLRQGLMPRRAGALSGGERQRAALARANAPRPDVIVLDEAFSALDVSMKVRVARLIIEQCKRLGTAVLFVTHDLPFVRYIADKVAVLYRGWVCDSGTASAIFEPPYHPYTEALVWAARRLEGDRPARLDLAGEAQQRKLAEIGCPYQFECHRKIGMICETMSPPLQPAGGGRIIACHIAIDDLKRMQAAEYDRPEVQRKQAQ